MLQSKYKSVIGPWHKYPDCGDEISYDSPGLAIPTSTISRIGELYPYYHTSLDTPDKINKKEFEEVVDVMLYAFSLMELNYTPIRKFTGNPSLANPDLNLYLEPINMSNLLNKAADLSLKDLETGEMFDPRNFQEFFLSNIEGKSDLINLAYQTKIPFDYIYKYCQSFGEKN